VFRVPFTSRSQSATVMPWQRHGKLYKDCYCPVDPYSTTVCKSTLCLQMKLYTDARRSVSTNKHAYKYYSKIGIRVHMPCTPRLVNL